MSMTELASRTSTIGISHHSRARQRNPRSSVATSSRARTFAIIVPPSSGGSPRWQPALHHRGPRQVLEDRRPVALVVLGRRPVGHLAPHEEADTPVPDGVAELVPRRPREPPDEPFLIPRVNLLLPGLRVLAVVPGQVRKRPRHRVVDPL